MPEKSKGYEKSAPRVFIRTFGCQMNEHDSAKMLMLLAAEGYVPVGNLHDADLILFNTCTVRERPHHKAISEVGKVLKLKESRPDLIVGVTGCVAQEEGAHLFELLPGLDIVLGPDQMCRLPELVRKVSDCRNGGVSTSVSATELVNNYDDYNFIIPMRDGSCEPRPTKCEPRVTSYVKIMKGCNNFCSFCIVPYVRGREVSKAPDDIITEIKYLCARGVKEVTLLGQNVNSYGLVMTNFPSPQPSPRRGEGVVTTFPELLRRISDETGILRIRYVSPHPKDLSDELIEEHRTNKKLCEHIHLPVQAGSTSVLKRMNRVYTREQYLDRVNSLKKAVPGIAITTDIIVGFPGETEKDFEETLGLMREVEFDGMFAFRYSVRVGTKAAEKYEDDVPIEIKKGRLSQVLELNQKIVLQKHKKYVGTRQEILSEGLSKKGGGQLTGRTRTNKVVNFEGCPKLVGKLVNVEITWAGPNSLKGVSVSGFEP